MMRGYCVERNGAIIAGSTILEQMVAGHRLEQISLGIRCKNIQGQVDHAPTRIPAEV
jgi:hypothetical protein